MTDDERSEADNAIWLCTICHTIVDNDARRFPVETLRLWRANAEMLAHSRLGKRPDAEFSAAPLVASYNQSGGQTALIINNNGRPPRTIHDKILPKELLARMRGRDVDNVVVVAYSGDSEAIGLAKEFAKFVNRIGWRDSVPDLARLMGAEGFGSGVRVQSVATDPSDIDDPLRAFAAWLKSLGFEVMYVYGAKGNYIDVFPQ
ncbi:hypothetical protein WME91_55065 [Sorangium sp. So ce269]